MNQGHGPAVADAGARADPTVRQDVRPVVGVPAAESSVRDLYPTTPASDGPAPVADAGLPKVGDEFLGFHLTELLGRGSFGRVFLAHQGELAGRPVALKIARGLFSESQTLARLQHTNIVPIYSVHQSGDLQAVCMPFFGRTTLARVLQGIRGQAVFPSSGHVLLSTLPAGGSATVPDGSPSAPGYPPPAQLDPTACARLRRLSYADAVVWLGAQLAAGLTHAHDRGILHRDLKPANVLLTDEGVPMILDFNLAEDTRHRAPDGLAGVGGTLPYMSPEQLAAFNGPADRLDAGTDVYSLGVLLYELFTGHRPFPDDTRGPLRESVERMLAVRRAGAPSPRVKNPAVARSIDAVVRKCLAPDPADRYPATRALQEDLERHLSHQPLRHVRERSWRERADKWAARHPRLTSSTSVAVVAAVLLGAAVSSALYGRERNRTYAAAAQYREHGADLRALQTFLDDRNRSVRRLNEGLWRCQAILERYGVSEDRVDAEWEQDPRVRYLPDAERAALRGEIGEVFYLMARVAYLRAVGAADRAERAEETDRAERWNMLAAGYAGDQLPRSLLEQRADLARLKGAPDSERAVRAQAQATAPGAARDHYLMGCWYAQLGHHREALPYLRKATLLDPEHFPAWFVRGTSHLALEQNEMAALCFGSCVALNKGHAPSWLNRGLAYSRLRFFDQACDDYDRALRLDSNLVEARLQRATAKEALGDLPGAIADLTAALNDVSAPTRVYFARAHFRERLGDRAGAAADRTEGLNLTPTDEMSWIARAEHRLDDPKSALADVEQALRLSPTSATGLQLKAHILAERLGRGPDAIPVLDRAVEWYPEYVPARAGRGVLLARIGDRAAAVADAEEALLRDTKGPNLYQVACIYALTSRTEPTDRVKAVELLRAALKTRFGLDLVDTDPDFDPIRKDPAFQRVVADAKAKERERDR
ncbi:MAG TPA: protein kinase [Gemmataceae bacterium]|nr:protein kinase [Gemmataceae bacterium]